MDSLSRCSSKQGVPESSRDIMNGHISDMKGNSSAGAAEDSSGLHKASRHHMTESDAVGDKHGLAVEGRHKGRSVVCPGRQQKILPLGRQCVSCVEKLFISPAGPATAPSCVARVNIRKLMQQHSSQERGGSVRRARRPKDLGAAEMIRISRR